MRHLWQWIRAIGRRRRIQAGLDEEIQFHIEQQTAKNLSDGMTPEDARRLAFLRFGAVEQTKEQTRDEFRIPALEDMAREFLYALRALRRTPAFTLAAVLTLGLGIGGTTAVFGVLNGVLLKPLPYPDPDRLIAVWHDAKGLTLAEMEMSASQYFTYREQNRVFEFFGVWSGGSVTVTGLGTPERVRSLRMTWDVLPAIGVAPALGRWFTPEEDRRGAPGTVMLSYGYWQRAFDGDRSVLGRAVTIDGEPRQIVGVMPRGFRFLDTDHELILPQRFDRGPQKLAPFNYRAVARLKPGVSIDEASADVARLIPIYLTSWPENGPGFAKMLENAKMGPNLRPLKQEIVGQVGDVLWILMGTIGIVLVIACANVANLLLVRVEGRQHELAVRVALGAGWWRIARALLSEHVALALMGGLAGLALTFVLLRALVAIAPSTLPRIESITVDARVLAFAVGTSLVSVLLFGLVPILRGRRQQTGVTLARSGRGVSDSRDRHRVRNLLLAGQVALSLVLLVASGLMIRTFAALRAVHPGFTQPEAIQLARVAFPGANSPDQTARTFAAIQAGFAAVPGVERAAFGVPAPMEMDADDAGDMIVAAGRTYPADQLPPVRRFVFISPGYFDAFGTSFVAGRDLTWADIESHRPVVIISENMAREMWGEPSAAIGQRVREHPRSSWREIIGVVRDVHRYGVHAKPPSVVYWPFLVENFWGNRLFVRDSVTFALRTPRAGTEGLADDLRRSVAGVNSSLPISGLQTQGRVYERSMARTSFALVMLTIASGMALALAVVGVYGVVAYTVTLRRREIGIRMALGAQRVQLTRRLVARGLLVVGAGVLCGIAGAVPVMGVMSSLLFGVKPVDAPTYAAVTLVLVAAALLASYVPARRTASIDPVEALRAE